jgi:hypothetical protein
MCLSAPASTPTNRQTKHACFMVATNPAAHKNWASKRWVLEICVLSTESSEAAAIAGGTVQRTARRSDRGRHPIKPARGLIKLQILYQAPTPAIRPSNTKRFLALPSPAAIVALHSMRPRDILQSPGAIKHKRLKVGAVGPAVCFSLCGRNRRKCLVLIRQFSFKQFFAYCISKLHLYVFGTAACN